MPLLVPLPSILGLLVVGSWPLKWLAPASLTIEAFVSAFNLSVGNMPECGAVAPESNAVPFGLFGGHC